MNYNEAYDFVKANQISNIILNHHAGRIFDDMGIALNTEIGTIIEF